MTSTTPTQLPSSDQKDLQLVLLTEMGHATRARSEPEHLYTAAALGSFAALAWGVAALHPETYSVRPLWSRPAMVAAIGVALVASGVVIKIVREHGKFAEIKSEQARIAARLASLPGAAGIIPERILSPVAGKGYLYSIAVVVLPAIAAICFCMAVV